MGLDMYLNKKIFIGANYKHRGVTGTINLKTPNPKDPDKPLKIKVNKKKVTYIIEQAGYWRKANQIHSWFVKNVQGGIDKCQESYVSIEQLTTLKELCEIVLKTKDANLLPPQEGFFFGSSEVDEYYWEDLKETVSLLKDLDPTAEYTYQASW